jgi:competence protein ComEC
MVSALRRFEVLVPACGLALAVSCSSEDPPGTDPGNAGSGGISGSSGASNSNGGSTQAGRGGSSSSANGGSSGSGASGGDDSGGPSNGGTAGSGGSSGSGGGAARLDIYWVDVEGGAATIIKTPDGKVLLTDTGNPGGRDSARILAVLEEQVGAEQLDHLIITHYHSDHVGGAAEVAAGIDVLEFIDHGESVEAGEGDGYPELAMDRRRTVVPGDTVPLGEVTLTIVQSHGQGLTSSLGTDTPNALCTGADARTKDVDENGMSVGYLLKFGNFEFLDLGDLTWGYEHELACPINKIGEVDLLQVPHHGLEVSSPPQLVQALNPLAAVASNGPNKGNEPSTYERLLGAPDLEAVWLVHRSESNDEEHNPPDSRIANPSSGPSDEAHFIHASVLPSGEFSILNSRNGHEETYQAR